MYYDRPNRIALEDAAFAAHLSELHRRSAERVTSRGTHRRVRLALAHALSSLARLLDPQIVEHHRQEAGESWNLRKAPMSA
jgi:hypothetical protein